MMEEIENVYYRLYPQLFDRIRKGDDLERLKKLINVDWAISIEANNKAFLSELRNRKPKGLLSCEEWLDFLMEDYVKRSGGKIFHPWIKTDCYEYFEWLDNTCFLCDDYPKVVEWCEDRRQLMNEVLNGKPQLINSQEVQHFIDEVGKILGKEVTESFLDKLPTIKPKKLKPFYQEHGRLHEKYSLKGFFELCESVVHRHGERGWNYENVK